MSIGMTFENSFDLFLGEIGILQRNLDYANSSLKSAASHCKPGKGLKCGSKKVLNFGEKFIVSSRRCRGGEYPANEKCGWSFDVSEECLPRVDCSYLHLAGNWRRG